MWDADSYDTTSISADSWLFAADAPPAVPPAPTFGVGGGLTYGTGRTVRPRYWRDDELIWLGHK